MKIHPHLIGHPDVNEKGLLELAKKVGLNKIDFNHGYKMVKLSSKDQKAKRNIHPGEWTKGQPYLIGNGKVVALYISGLNEWMQTSPIVKVRKVKAGFKIETQNSFYLLATGEVKTSLPYCESCKKKIKVNQKLNCYTCSKCRLVLGYGFFE